MPHPKVISLLSPWRRGNRIRLSSLALLLAAASGSIDSVAHLPEVYGRDYLRTKNHVHELPVKPPSAPASTVPERGEIDRQQSQLKAAERANGPYADGLTDPLVNLAAMYRHQGDLEKSVEQYLRALHLVRVNDGLYSERQIPIMRELMALYRRQNDLQSLGGLYHYYARVLKLGRSPIDSGKVDDALEYLRWERELYSTRRDGMQRIHLARAYEVNEALLESLEPVAVRNRDAYLQLALSQMQNLYLLLGDDPLSTLPGNQTNDRPEAAKAERMVGWIQKIALAEGRKILERCLSLTADAPAATRAGLHLELGDWHQWNDDLNRARPHYMEVMTILSDAGEEALLEQWLGQPMELPDEGDMWGILDRFAVDREAVVEASYAVTSRGTAQAISVSVSDEAYGGHARQIKRMLRETHFRPRYDRDGPQVAERVTRYYRLIDIP